MPLLLGLAACTDWPTWRHIEPPADAVPAGTDPADVLSERVDWQAEVDEREPNDTPALGVSIGRGQGVQVRGQLSSGGWDPERPVDRSPAEDCDRPRFFPLPADPANPAASTLGDYSGDVDWVAVEPLRDGVLCARVDLAAGSADFDLLLLTLDRCAVPVALPGGVPFPYPSSVPGYAISDVGALWQAEVPAAEPLAIALAAWGPLDAPTDWTLTLTLEPPSTDGGPVVCPAAPESP